MNKTDSGIEARQLFLSEYQAVLSTISVDVAGYPFGSVVPYCVNQAGLPVILISDIAQHTKNILVDNRVSLITLERNMADQQAAGRVTLVGDAEKLAHADADSMSRYYTYYPHARDYHKTHGFDFYVIKPKRIRFIGGFGRIHWLDKEVFLKPNIFCFDEESRIIEHMNDDHADAVKHYCDIENIDTTIDDKPVMVGIDAEGIHIRIDSAIHRVAFPEPIQDSKDARKALVEMSRQGQ